ncbi:MAG: hypothetical protein HZC36_00575 [Armatimonadetes bacterium]|nr:hypothetical protein [Armatimonadota bacterium]
MTWTRRRYALYLSLLPGVGARSVRKALLRMDLLGISPDSATTLSVAALREELGLSEAVARKIANPAPGVRDHALGLLQRLETYKVQVVTAVDPHYPARVERFDPDAPAALFFYGNMRLLEGRTFSVLSSNHGDSEALNRIERLAESGVLNSEILVTGHNRAEYMRAAVVPLRWGSPRILCLDRGLIPALGETLSEEPFAAARLWRYKFDPTTDLVATPASPESGYGRPYNWMRDRLIASLSDRIDFAFIRPSGTMQTIAGLALKAGVPVRVRAQDEAASALLDQGAEALPDGS